MGKEWYCLLGLYLLVATLAAFFLMGMDKYRARRSKRRVPERTLFPPFWVGRWAAANHVFRVWEI